MRPVIVLPTYNEKENLADIVANILALNIPGLRIIIVDDNSPDGTGQIADELARTFSGIEVIHRPKKEGLGRAYLAGFNLALASKDNDCIFEMDADFSHQPKFLPVFLKEIEMADVVLGSRYISGGKVENWGFFRRFISRQANFIIHLVLRLPVKDLTGGFKCWRRHVLEQLDLNNVESSGYNFQIELTYKAYRRGFQIVETPIVFVERRAGRSKFSIFIMLESFWKVLKLRFTK